MRPNKNTLQPSLSEKFSGLIWKLKVHERGLIAIETRNAESRQVAFSAFDFITGETKFKEKTYDEGWNLSLAFAGQQNIVLNGYEHAQTPESKGILSVSSQDGSIIWQQFNVSLNDVQNAGMQVYDSRIQPRRYYWIDHNSAAVIPAPGSDVNPAIFFPEIDNKFIIPAIISHGVLAGELSVLHHSDKVIVSFHEVNADQMQQRLVVYQGDKILLDDILISGIQKLQPEAFFIQQNHLFCIRSKEEIVAYLV